MMRMPFWVRMSSAYGVTGPFAASATNLHLIRSAFLRLISFSPAAGITKSLIAPYQVHCGTRQRSVPCPFSEQQLPMGWPTRTAPTGR